MTFLDEVLYELNHLKDLTALVNKRGRLLPEVRDLRKRIHCYINSIPSAENIESSADIVYLINYLSSF